MVNDYSKTSIVTSFDEKYFDYAAVMVKSLSNNYHEKNKLNLTCLVPKNLLDRETDFIRLIDSETLEIDFFDDACKKYVDSGSSVYWDEWLIDIIERLKNGEKVILWGNLGKKKKLYPLSDKNKIVAFRDAWTKYNIVESSDEDLNDESEDIESDKIVNEMEKFVKDMKKMSLNPNAKTFVPGQNWSPKKRSAEDVLMQLDEKIQRLIDMQCVHNTPICYAQAV